MSAKTINGPVSIVQSTPPFEPLAESSAFMVASTPRHWLALRKMVRNMYTDGLSLISETIQEALLYTDELTLTQERYSDLPRLVLDHLEHILARRMVLQAIQREISAFAPNLALQNTTQGPLGSLMRNWYHHQHLSCAKYRNTEVLLLYTLQQLYTIALGRLNKSPNDLISAGKLSQPQRTVSAV